MPVNPVGPAELRPSNESVASSLVNRWSEIDLDADVKPSLPDKISSSYLGSLLGALGGFFSAIGGLLSVLFSAWGKENTTRALSREGTLPVGNPMLDALRDSFVCISSSAEEGGPGGPA